jgi:hypothetical protein
MRRREFIAGTGLGATWALTPTAGFSDRSVTDISMRKSAVREPDFINVKEFGALGNSVHDDTAAITAAFVYADANFCGVFFPPGNYLYNGAGYAWSNQRIYLSGAGHALSNIVIGDGYYLIDTPHFFNSVRIEDLQFSGGLGAFRSTRTNALVGIGGDRVISRCLFYNYTQCAIQANCSDGPSWEFYNNGFQGANSTSTIGIALSWGGDQIIRDNNFGCNRVHIKIRGITGASLIEANVFTQLDGGDAGSPRMAIWEVPSSAYAAGGIIRGNKFGNENFASFDYKIVVAEESTGTWNGDKMPALSTASSNNIVGRYIVENNSNGAGDYGQYPFIFSTTPNLSSCYISNNTFGGSLPSCILQFLSGVVQPNNLNLVNILGPCSGGLLASNPGFKVVSNGPNLGFAPDPNCELEGILNTHHSYIGGGDAADFQMIFSSASGGLSIGGGTTLVGSATDATGGSDAAQYAWGGYIIGGYIAAASLTVGRPAWIEFDLKQGDTNPATFIRVQVTDWSHYNNADVDRYIEVPISWKRFRFPFSFRDHTGGDHIGVMFEGTATQQIYIGRVRLYYGREPLTFGRAVFEQLNLSALPTSSTGLAAGSIWVDTANGNVLKRV